MSSKTCLSTNEGNQSRPLGSHSVRKWFILMVMNCDHEPETVHGMKFKRPRNSPRQEKSCPSSCRVLSQSQIPPASVHRMLREWEFFLSLQIATCSFFKSQQIDFAINMLNYPDQDQGYFNRMVLYGDKATFHICRKENKHNLLTFQFWGPQSPYEVVFQIA